MFKGTGEQGNRRNTKAGGDRHGDENQQHQHQQQNTTHTLKRKERRERGKEREKRQATNRTFANNSSVSSRTAGQCVVSTALQNVLTASAVHLVHRHNLAGEIERGVSPYSGSFTTTQKNILTVFSSDLSHSLLIVQSTHV